VKSAQSDKGDRTTVTVKAPESTPLCSSAHESHGSCAEVSSANRRLLTLANLLQEEKEYSKQLDLLKSSNASLALFIAYAAAWSHANMLRAGSLAEALKS
jgi:hypothetical protein